MINLVLCAQIIGFIMLVFIFMRFAYILEACSGMRSRARRLVLRKFFEMLISRSICRIIIFIL